MPSTTRFIIAARGTCICGRSASSRHRSECATDHLSCNGCRTPSSDYRRGSRIFSETDAPPANRHLNRHPDCRYDTDINDVDQLGECTGDLSSDVSCSFPSSSNQSPPLGHRTAKHAHSCLFPHYFLIGASTPDIASTKSGKRWPWTSIVRTNAFNSAISDDVRRTPAAPLFSSMCATNVVPGIGTIHGFWVNSHANAI